jgi:ABC-type transport system involved in multi-copper enzyme maturation permease subunit
MAIEEDILPYFQWLFVGNEQNWGALWQFLFFGLLLTIVAMGIGFLVAAIRHGPMKAGDLTYRVMLTGLRELPDISRRRVWALAKLAIHESIRGRVIVTFVVFAVILLFAGWFLDSETNEPAKLYLSFVLTATMYLVLALALLLSVFSLPGDIKNRTIYTIVTKPVRSGEIVLGRIIGFSAVGTLILVVMCVISYFFVIRALSHTHEVESASLKAVSGAAGTESGRTTREMFHRHDATIFDDGQGETDTELGHWHEIEVIQDEGETTYQVSTPRDMLQARVARYGKLRFLDRTGQDSPRGISVGNEWTYRSYIEGGTQAAAIWTFDDITKEKYPDGLPLELTIRVFRSYKGDIEKGILGGIIISNPDKPETDPTKSSDIRTFTARDFATDVRTIPRKLKTPDGTELDLFDDLVTKDGRVEVRLICMDRAQYFGMAQADVYLRDEGGNFEWNFVKGYLSIWVQMVIVVSLGVLFSTFLSGPVAMMATLTSIVLGFFTSFLLNVAVGEIEGGGPIESLVRLVTQKNVTIELDESAGTTIVQTLDQGLKFFMEYSAKLLPNFQSYSNIKQVAYGFNISADLVAQNLTACLGYVLAAFVAGYFFFRIREVAK